MACLCYRLQSLNPAQTGVVQLEGNECRLSIQPAKAATSPVVGFVHALVYHTHSINNRGLDEDILEMFIVDLLGMLRGMGQLVIWDNASSHERYIKHFTGTRLFIKCPQLFFH